MVPRERRQLAAAVMDAMRAQSLHEQQVATAGNAEASRALAGRWTPADHEFYKALRFADGDGD